MIGGSRYNRGSVRLQEENANNIQNDESDSSINEDLFSSIAEAENHAKQILKTGRDQYVAGIKQNVVEMVRRWLEPEDDNCFTLYGKMGCGKSFFAGHLYGQLGEEKELFDTAAFSSQQTYRDTTAVRTMLISLAHQLYIHVGACRDYFHTQKLDSTAIEQLTESVLIKPFEGKRLQKTAVLIIDGLDEYPRRDCEAFLETLGQLRPRMNQRVKIFFTSRPERYICSLFQSGSTNSYHIEKNKAQSQADCARFIDAKCQGTGIHIDADMKQTLITKSEASLKYLECFFNDLAYGGMELTADLINDLPKGLSQYYRGQLLRYFSGNNLSFYQEELAPLLELLCVASRHLTLQEAADILGRREKELNQVISRSGTLVWKNDDYVMLYQAESVREFLTDDSCCPEDYLIDCTNGHQRILERLDEIIDSDEDIESNMYLFNCVADHILSQKRVTKQDWKRVIDILTHYSHKFDLRTAFFRRILERNVNEIVQFLRLLMADNRMHALLKAVSCVRLISNAISEKQEEKLSDVLARLEGEEEFQSMYHYGMARIYWAGEKNALAFQEIVDHLPEAQEDIAFCSWRICYLEFYADLRKKQKDVSRLEVTEQYIAVYRETMDMVQLCPRPDTAVQLVILRNKAISCGQMARLCEELEGEPDPHVRVQCAKKIQDLLQLPDIQPGDKGYLLQAAAEYYRQRKKLHESCRDHDLCSESRVYDLHHSCQALGRLCFNKQYPGYDPDRGLQYFEEYLSQMVEIAQRPDSPVRYIRSVIITYNHLVKLYSAEENYGAARLYLAKAQQMRMTRLQNQPSVEADFNVCFGYEQEAALCRAEHGMETAEPLYQEAIRRYKACGQQYTELFVQRALQVVYHNMSIGYRDENNFEQALKYRLLELEESKRICGLYPSHKHRWEWAVSAENVLVLLRRVDRKGTLPEQLQQGESALAIYEELAAANPEDPQYQTGPCYLYCTLFSVHLDLDQIPEALHYLDAAFKMYGYIALHAPQHRAVLHYPLVMFLQIRQHLTDTAILQKYYEDCKAYIALAAPYCCNADFAEQRCAVLRNEAKMIWDRDGFPAAVPYYEEGIKIAQEAALRWKSPGLNWSIAFYYFSMHLGYRENKEPDVAKEKLLQAKNVLDQALDLAPTNLDLMLFLARVCGYLAEENLKNATFGGLKEAAGLMIRQAELFSHLLPIPNGPDLSAENARALQRLIKLGEQTEKLIAEEEARTISRVDYLLAFLHLAIQIFAFLAEQHQPNAQEKLEHYTQMKEQLTQK